MPKTIIHLSGGQRIEMDPSEDDIEIFLKCVSRFRRSRSKRLLAPLEDNGGLTLIDAANVTGIQVARGKPGASLGFDFDFLVQEG